VRLGIDYKPVIQEGIPTKNDGLTFYSRWWEEQRLRILNGWTTPWGEYISADMYFYLNFGTILGFKKPTDTKKSPMSPLYMDGQHGLFLAAQDVVQRQREGKSGKAGLVVPKGRRKGVSWVVVHMFLRRLIAEPNSVTAIGSDGEVKQGYVNDFRLKLKFAYNALPAELRSNINVKNGAVNNMDLIRSQYKEIIDGQEQVMGLQSEMHFKNTYDPNCFKGLGLDLGYIEEAGEVGKLLETIGESKDCYKEGEVYYGLQLVGGTSNKISHESEDFQNLCLNPEKYDFSVYFYPATVNYYPFYDHNTGISDRARATLAIDEQVDKYKAQGELKAMWSFIQNNPKELEDCFQIVGDSKLNVEAIRKQMGWLLTKPTVLEKLRRGRFEWHRDTSGKELKDRKPKFVDDPFGLWELYTDAYHIPGYEVSSIDSYYLSNEFGGGVDTDSKGAMTVYRQFIDMETPGEYVVAQYHGRPKSKVEWYEETAKGNMYFSIKRKCLVEYNDEELLRWYIDNGYESTLMLRPVAADAPNSVAQNRYGIHFKSHQKDLTFRLMDEYINRSCDSIMFHGLLKELSVYGLKNTDRAITFGLCLLADFSLKAWNRPKGSQSEMPKEEIRPTLVDRDGIPVMVSHMMAQYPAASEMRTSYDRWANLP